MAVRAYLKVKDEDGRAVAQLDDFRVLAWQHRVNGPGSLLVQLNGDDARTALFELDGQLELWRSDFENGLGWYIEKEAFHRSVTDNYDDQGLRTFTSYGAGYLDLAAREAIAYRAGSSFATKSGTASSVMREYVKQNIGEDADSASRYQDGVQPGLSLGPDPAAGGTWSGSRAHQNLLDVLQEIANEAGIDFDIVGISASDAGPDLYEFRVYSGQRGRDRTETGLDQTTGFNSAGYAPLTFSLELGNMQRPQYALARADEINVVYVLGPGQGDVRLITTRSYAPGVHASKRNRRAVTRNAPQETTEAARAAVGDALLDRYQARETLSFQVLQLPRQFYGNPDKALAGFHPDLYWLGDRVIARYGTREFTERIVGVRGTLRPTQGTGGLVETIELEIAPAP